MAIGILKKLFARDLSKLRNEIVSYQLESNIWKTEKNIANSGGNLCLHLIGNLNTYIGKELGGTDYIRDRPAEFALKNVPRARLLSMIDETMKVVNTSLERVSEEDLQKEYPIRVFDEMTSTEFLLIHLATHLTYHLGQVNYHRRLID